MSAHSSINFQQRLRSSSTYNRRFLNIWQDWLSGNPREHAKNAFSEFASLPLFCHLASMRRVASRFFGPTTARRFSTTFLVRCAAKGGDAGAPLTPAKSSAVAAAPVPNPQGVHPGHTPHNQDATVGSHQHSGSNSPHQDVSAKWVDDLKRSMEKFQAEMKASTDQFRVEVKTSISGLEDSITTLTQETAPRLSPWVKIRNILCPSMLVEKTGWPTHVDIREIQG